MRSLLVGMFVLSWLASEVCAQTARYRGREYTPQNYPKAIWHSDGMCLEIKRQWASQGWIPPQGAPMPRGWQRPRQVEPSYATVKSLDPSPARSSRPLPQGEVKYRTETRTRNVPYQVKVCHGSYCTIETRYRTESYQVRVPVMQEPKDQEDQEDQEPSPERSARPLPQGEVKIPDASGNSRDAQYAGTPADVAAAVMWLLCPDEDDVVVDLGCGYGELLVAAQPYGCRLVGVEIDSTRADVCRQRLPEAKIVEGDMLQQTYTHGTIYLIYSHSDIAAEVAKVLPAGSLMASLEHEVDGLEMIETVFSVNGTEHRLYTGVIQ